MGAINCTSLTCQLRLIDVNFVPGVYSEAKPLGQTVSLLSNSCLAFCNYFILPLKQHYDPLHSLPVESLALHLQIYTSPYISQRHRLLLLLLLPPLSDSLSNTLHPLLTEQRFITSHSPPLLHILRRQDFLHIRWLFLGLLYLVVLQAKDLGGELYCWFENVVLWM